MKVYFASVKKYLLKGVFSGANVLLSFTCFNRGITQTIPAGDFSSIMLDSGAFSAFRSGRAIDIIEYCEFIERNMDGIELYVNLDVIGDPETSLANLRFMESQGLSPIPVFHHGEDFGLLHWMRDNYPLIGLGGMVPRSRTRMFDWLSVILDKCPHDYHGFGIGDVRLIRAFPFFSIDNTSWKHILPQTAMKTTASSGINWAEHLTYNELYAISRKFYERLCNSQ